MTQKIRMRAVLDLAYDADPDAYADDGEFTPALVQAIDHDNFETDPHNFMSMIDAGCAFEVNVLTPTDVHPEFERGVARAHSYLVSLAKEEQTKGHHDQGTPKASREGAIKALAIREAAKKMSEALKFDDVSDIRALVELWHNTPDGDKDLDQMILDKVIKAFS